MADIKKMAVGLIGLIVLAILVFNIYSGTSDTIIQTAGNLSSSNETLAVSSLPLNTLFQSQGVVFLLLSSSILLTLIGAMLVWYKTKK